MRIISGEFRRRLLQSPPEGSGTRPIPDRVKESVFSILRGHFEGAAVLDCFAGTGSIGLEALSRGASRVVMVEKDRRVAAVLQENVDLLGEDAAGRCEVVVGDALGTPALSRCPKPAKLIFCDPPYALVQKVGEEGWDRVRRQFGRLIDLLSDDGYAMLRTPWPFYHGGEPIVEEAEEEAPQKKRGKGRVEHLKFRRGSSRHVHEDARGREVEVFQDAEGNWIAPGERTGKGEAEEAVEVDEGLEDEKVVGVSPRVMVSRGIL